LVSGEREPGRVHVAATSEGVAGSITWTLVADRVAEEIVYEAADARVHEVFEHDVLGVLRAQSTCLKETEASLQEEAEQSSNDNPDEVERVGDIDGVPCGSVEVAERVVCVSNKLTLLLRKRLL